MSQKTITITIENWEELVEAYTIANGDEPGANSDEWVLKRMESLLFAQYRRGVQDKKKKEATINKSIITVVIKE